MAVNTRTSLWSARWPAIAHHVLEDGRTCVETVEAAEPDEQSVVKWNLPCADCEKSSQCLNARRKELGPLLYDREIQTKPRSAESSLFPEELFEPCLRRGESFVPWWHKPFGIESRYSVASAWDIAWSENIGGDFLVKMTAVLDRQTGKRKIIDIWRDQKIRFAKQVELVQSEWLRYRDDLVVIEGDAAQQVWAQYVGDTSAVPIVSHNSTNKTDLEAGVPKLILSLEQQRWEIPFEQGTFHHENAEVFLAEAEAFGWVDGKLQGVGEHDDVVMCWWHLDFALDRLQHAGQGGQRWKVQEGSYI